MLNIITLILLGVALLALGILIGMSAVYEKNYEILSDRADKLDMDLREVEEKLEEQKPKDKYRVELKHRVDGEVKTTIIPNVVNILKNGGFNGYEYIESTNIIFEKEDGKFIVNKDDVISIDKTKQEVK